MDSYPFITIPGPDTEAEDFNPSEPQVAHIALNHVTHIDRRPGRVWQGRVTRRPYLVIHLIGGGSVHSTLEEFSEWEELVRASLSK